MQLPVNAFNVPNYKWGNNCQAFVLANWENAEIKQELIPPGEGEKLHWHEKSTQFFFVLNGEAEFILDNQKHYLKAQDGILVNPNSVHCIQNNSENPLTFLVFSQPPVGSDRIEVSS